LHLDAAAANYSVIITVYFVDESLFLMH